MSEEVDTRKKPSERTKCIVWAQPRAVARCATVWCWENEQLGEPVSIGELAHNVGATTGSPRVLTDPSGDERAEPENLLLVCRSWHKPVDDGGPARSLDGGSVAREEAAA